MSPMVRLLNQALKVFWTIIGFAPLVVFWHTNGTAQALSVCLVISFPFLMIPSSAFVKLQISHSRQFYKRLGVKWAQNFTQHGLLMNRLIRKNMPAYSLVKSRRDLPAYKKWMMVYASYHMACLIFFIASLTWALILHQYVVSILIFFANILYMFTH